MCCVCCVCCMLTLHCKNPECLRAWDYKGRKSYPAYIACPDCLRRVQIPKEPEEPEPDAESDESDS